MRYNNIEMPALTAQKGVACEIFSLIRYLLVNRIARRLPGVAFCLTTCHASSKAVKTARGGAVSS